MPEFDSMNETDVREVIVRPFLESLGYKHGTQATIRTEVPLRYDKAFLGRKNPAKDPALGRADYICEAIGYGRFVVEVKAPNREITLDNIEQAHTYAAHPEIAALYFLVTNGLDFQLFMTSRLDFPLFRWTYWEVDKLRPQIEAILEFEAIKKYARKITPDTGRPLGKGLPAQLNVNGGEIVYGAHHSDHPLLKDDIIGDSVAPITEGLVKRDGDGRISAQLRVMNVTGASRKMNEKLGLDRFEFAATAQEISRDANAPTIFKNIQIGTIEEGEIIDTKEMGEMPLPFAISFEVFSEAIGYLDNKVFKGVVSFDYKFALHHPQNNLNPSIRTLLASVPQEGKLAGSGEFSVRFSDI